MALAPYLTGDCVLATWQYCPVTCWQSSQGGWVVGGAVVLVGGEVVPGDVVFVGGEVVGVENPQSGNVSVFE